MNFPGNKKFKTAVFRDIFYPDITKKRYLRTNIVLMLAVLSDTVFIF